MISITLASFPTALQCITMSMELVLNDLINRIVTPSEGTSGAPHHHTDTYRSTHTSRAATHTTHAKESDNEQNEFVTLNAPQLFVLAPPITDDVRILMCDLDKVQAQQAQEQHEIPELSVRVDHIPTMSVKDDAVEEEEELVAMEEEVT